LFSFYPKSDVDSADVAEPKLKVEAPAQDAVAAAAAAAAAPSKLDTSVDYNAIWSDYVTYMEHQRDKGWKT
jgi:hypothetical protein